MKGEKRDEKMEELLAAGLFKKGESSLPGDHRLTPVGAMYAVMNRIFPGQVTMEMSRRAYFLLAEWAASEVMYEYDTGNSPNTYAAIVFKGSGEVLGVMDKNEKTRRKKNAGMGRSKAA